jgi:SAM-dependent methyltransferase
MLAEDGRAGLRAWVGGMMGPAQAAEWDQIPGLGTIPTNEQESLEADLGIGAVFAGARRALDVGAGTGALTSLLAGTPGLEVWAIEPAPAMLDRLRAKIGLEGVRSQLGTVDAAEDVHRLPAAHFDLITLRQVANTLPDPLQAFANLLHWMAPGGRLILMDGMFERESYRGENVRLLDQIPLSTQRNLALVPYLLEKSGFCIDRVTLLEATNRLPHVRTPRYGVLAHKPPAGEI